MILSWEHYPKMKKEVLVNEEDAIVIPVRNSTSPHFRRMGQGAFRRQIGITEKNETHKRCIRLLMKHLNGENKKRLIVLTNVFSSQSDEEGEKAKSEQQTIFEQKGEYRWFSENDARIAFGDGSYIVPDIGGRDPSCFFPRVGSGSVLIEVIQTHPPDMDTFFHLLELSGSNFLVVFFFVEENGWDSSYNRISIKENERTLQICPAHYLMGGEVFKNGRSWVRRENESDKDWYDYLANSYFKIAMEGK